MNSKFFHKSEGEIILRFYNSERSIEGRFTFDNMDTMFKQFHKGWKLAQKDKLYHYEILRYCVDNSTYRDEHSTNWFLQVREVADQRQERDHLFGLKILFDQYLFEKGEN